MAILSGSGKLGGRGRGYMLRSGKTVFFRVKGHGNNEFEFMTATADEDSGEFRHYADQENLIKQTCDILDGQEHEFTLTNDQQGRPYVTSSMLADEEGVCHLANLILDKLGIEGDIFVQAIRELTDMYENLVHEDGEDAYLGDGIYITSDARIISK